MNNRQLYHVNAPNIAVDGEHQEDRPLKSAQTVEVDMEVLVVALIPSAAKFALIIPHTAMNVSSALLDAFVMNTSL